MRTIKLYGFPSHQTKERTSGVDFARVIQPMKHLNGYTDGEVIFETTLYDINKEPRDNWVDIAKEYDAVFLNYTVLDVPYAYMGAPIRGEGKKIIYDLDDAIWYVNPDNIVHDQLKELNAGYLVTCMLDDADGVVTTNGYLRNIIADKSYKRHKDILVAPNCIDFELYNKTFTPKKRNEVVLMHFGSTSHFSDLLRPDFVEGVDRILKEYPNVRLKTVGAFIPEFRYKWGNRYENAFGDVDIYRWISEKFPLYMEEADIMVVPLIDNVYNRGKSDIKAMEIGSTGKPAVFSSTRPYIETIEHGKTGFLANSADEWYQHIKALIDSIELRKKLGSALYRYVRSYRQAKDIVPLYAGFIRRILGY